MSENEIPIVGTIVYPVQATGACLVRVKRIKNEEKMKNEELPQNIPMKILLKKDIKQ
jgi:hypothetical protein